MAAPARAGPALALVFNAFVWGVSWWPFRQLEQAGLHALWATALIYALCALVITLRRPGAWRVLATQPALWLIVLASGTTNAAFNWAVTIGDVVRVVLLFYLMPLWAVLLARGLLGERLTPAALARVALALAGAMVVLWPEGGGWPWPRTPAEALGVLGGFAFALNNVMLRREAAQPEAARALAMFVGGALVAGSLALALGGRGVPLPAGAAWVPGALLLAALFLASNLALQYGAARLPAQVTALVMLTEVLFASASALALGAGRLDAQLLAGGAAIVGAALLAARGARLSPLPSADTTGAAMATSIYDFEALSIEGKRAHLGTQRGKVLLIVNTASECGFTPQFAGLEQLWKDYRDRGLVVVGFPSNEFGGQDPGDNEQIASFCAMNYGVSFPMMGKVEVNGANAHPVWKWLTKQAPGLLGSEAVKWNFTKFLVGRDGQVIKRYAPKDSPESLRQDIEAALAAPAA
jgi:glutathione peroxidase-family protein/drug/metabolite transporter (DMT)-like permease